MNSNKASITRQVNVITKKKNKHDSLVDILEACTRSDYELTVKDVEFRSSRGRVIGQLDYGGIYHRGEQLYADLYEVKCTGKEKNKEKALHQLSRLEDYLQIKYPCLKKCVFNKIWVYGTERYGEYIREQL